MEWEIKIETYFNCYCGNGTIGNRGNYCYQ